MTTTTAALIDPVTGRPATMRPYQAEAAAAPRQCWADPQRPETRLVVLLPTGGGKTVIMANVVRDELRTQSAPKIVILVHRDELVKQTIAKIEQWNPGLRVGVVKASRNDVFATVVVASVQTLGRSEARRKALGKVSLIIVDECHHAVAETYLAVIRDLGGFDQHARTRVLGFTATLERSDKLGLGDVWQRVVFSRDIEWMFEQGFLVRPRTERVRLDMDLDGTLSSLGQHGGDYSARALAAAMKEAHAPEAIAAAYSARARHADGSLMRGVVFVPTVQFARDTRAAFTATGIVAELITGETSSEDRDLIYKRFEAGEVDALINAMVLTEGFDAPWIEVVVIARPTKSRGLYIQMVGRGARPHTFVAADGSKRRKQSFLVLDVSGASKVNDLRTVANTAPTGEGVRERMAAQAVAARQRAENRAQPPKVEVSYRLHQRRGYGRKGVVVERIQVRSGVKTVVTVAKLYGHPMPRLLDMGREVVKADQEERAERLREAIRVRRGVVNR